MPCATSFPQAPLAPSGCGVASEPQASMRSSPALSRSLWARSARDPVRRVGEERAAVGHAPPLGNVFDEVAPVPPCDDDRILGPLAAEPGQAVPPGILHAR